MAHFVGLDVSVKPLAMLEAAQPLAGWRERRAAPPRNADGRHCCTGGIGCVAVAARAQNDGYLPDRKLTPGAFAADQTAVIYTAGYSRAHRVWHDKAGTLAKYHIPRSAAGQFEDDDLIPLCLGGDNASPLNHWPQPNTGQCGAQPPRTSSKGRPATRSA